LIAGAKGGVVDSFRAAAGNKKQDRQHSPGGELRQGITSKSA
jgi:hypothetical protein